MKQNKPTTQTTQITQTQKGRTTATATGSKTNSVTFERCDYDTKQHLLRAQFKQGGNSITCSINENVLTEIYGCTATEKDLKASFTEHEPQISRVLLAKIANKQWKVPNKEIQLNAQDLI